MIFHSYVSLPEGMVSGFVTWDGPPVDHVFGCPALLVFFGWTSSAWGCSLTQSTGGHIHRSQNDTGNPT